MWSGHKYLYSNDKLIDLLSFFFWGGEGLFVRVYTEVTLLDWKQKARCLCNQFYVISVTCMSVCVLRLVFV